MMVLLFVFLLLFQITLSGGTRQKQTTKSNIGKDICDGLFWFHAPKTGSTLYMALQHVCCPDQFESLVANISTTSLISNDLLPSEEKQFRYKFNHGSIYFLRNNHTMDCKARINIDHNPIKTDPETKPNHRVPPMMVVGVIREPKSRIISSFLDGMHAEGMTNSIDFKMLMSKWQKTYETDAENEKRLVGFAQDYANHPNMIGCQVKMLNGLECYSPTLFPFPHNIPVNTSAPGYKIVVPQYNRSIPLNQTAIDIAMHRLRGFRFVGIFDQFNASMHLLHSIMSSNSSTSIRRTEPSPVELYQQRNTSKHLARLLHKHVTVHDPYDSLLYAEAQRIFKEQLARHNLTTATKLK